MMFFDRKDAGQQLARVLSQYQNENPLILAIPRGGVILGAEVARHLDADFSILVSRKLPDPINPETGFGAVAEDGNLVMWERARARLSPQQIDEIVKTQKQVIQKRIKVLRAGKPLPEIENRTVILIDDGIAMGSTMIAAIKLCHNKNAEKIIVAVPVAGSRVAEEIQKMVDNIIVLETPANFRAVAQVYQNWHDVTDAEAIEVIGHFDKR